MTKELTILQPYVPTYRVSFFEGLRRQLHKHDINCVIAAGVPSGIQAARQDSVERDWIVRTKSRTAEIKGRTFDLGSRPVPWEGADGVIIGLEGTSIPLYKALATSRARALRVGVWGHVKPYVNQGHRIDLALERAQMRVANHIFAYTPGGAKYASSAGIDPNKITTVMNTVDTSQLQQDLAAVSDADIAEFSNRLGVNIGKTFCFIGGLDQSKRIDFLSEALDALWEIDSNIKLIVGGKGRDEKLLKSAIGRGQVVSIGYLSGRNKALALKTSMAVCMPGRIGLVAVDALVAGRPVITTAWPYHAPEAEYLVEGKSRITSADDPTKFAWTLKNFTGFPRATEPFPYPDLSDMIRNYAQGVVRMFSN
ncbi:glycosyltransferase [Kocuria oceani]|uniref:D-inositol 3-phosphate glycosyltransferase n=1 Tax=Kocuria oceani TaxID=988827 RepID=A0ABV9TFV0_9MICC|nr:glycosyltransferase [Kocuria oceani]